MHDIWETSPYCGGPQGGTGWGTYICPHCGERVVVGSGFFIYLPGSGDFHQDSLDTHQYRCHNCKKTFGPYTPKDPNIVDDLWYVFTEHGLTIPKGDANAQEQENGEWRQSVASTR